MYIVFVDTAPLLHSPTLPLFKATEHSFYRPLANAIQHVHWKIAKNKHAINKCDHFISSMHMLPVLFFFIIEHTVLSDGYSLLL